MSQLYDLRLLIEAKIKADGMDMAKVKGQIALQSGRMLALINPSTADDPEAVSKLKQAAKSVLNMNV